jgi:hypothetical protein
VSEPSDLKEALRERVFALGDVDEAPSRFGGTGLAFRRGARELAHFHPDAEIDIRLPRPQQRALRGDPSARPRPSPSDWIAYRLDSRADVERAFELVKAAWEAAG